MQLYSAASNNMFMVGNYVQKNLFVAGTYLLTNLPPPSHRPLSISLVANQLYKTGSPEEYVILYNDALLKCNIPSFVADFVSVDSWEDSEGSSYHLRPGSVDSTSVLLTDS